MEKYININNDDLINYYKKLDSLLENNTLEKKLQKITKILENFKTLNLKYSKKVEKFCKKFDIKKIDKRLDKISRLEENFSDILKKLEKISETFVIECKTTENAKFTKKRKYAPKEFPGFLNLKTQIEILKNKEENLNNPSNTSSIKKEIVDLKKKIIELKEKIDKKTKKLYLKERLASETSIQENNKFLETLKKFQEFIKSEKFKKHIY